MQNLILLTSAIFTALSAGLLFGYAVSVNPGLNLLPNAEYLSAMQQINRAILNPAFFICYFSPFLLLPLSAWLEHGKSNTAFWCWAAAAGLYILGVLGVTIFGNVPLNNLLENFNIGSATGDQLAEMRDKYEQSWNRLHLIRTGFALIATCLAIAGVMLRGK
jgi:uncharacterized membrane protein